MKATQLHKIALGGKSEDQLFQEHWKDHGFEGVKIENGQKVTPSLQQGMDKETADSFKGRTREKMAEFQQKDLVDSGEVDGATPIIFDPEIISVLKQEAPMLDLIPQEGQQGFRAKYNIITARTSPLGFMGEGDASDLTDNTAQDVTFTTNTSDMKIWVDLVDISDFSQAAAEHYMNVEDTVLGERLALFAQRKAQQILYGDTSQNINNGYLGDSDGYDGMNALADSGNVIDKSGTSSNFIDDIKSVIASMKQNESLNPNDLVAVTSYTFFDVLQDEIGLDNMSVRPQDLDDAVNVGARRILIDNVPVTPTHNVDNHTDGGYSPGDVGDVFIFSPRAIRFRALVPLSTIPLAKLGLSETSAIFEFGTLIDKSDGNWIRHLQAYNF